MAVEASHLNLFSPQFLATREMMIPFEANGNMFETRMGYGVPLSTAAATQGLLPSYNSLVTDQKTVAPAIKSESTLTCNNLPLKRSRDLFQWQPHNINDISFHMEQQQFDIDRLISQHMEEMRTEIEEKRKRQAQKLMEAVEERVTKKLRGKDEEIEKIEKLNWALEERVKSLCIENQIWRDLAQTNEATATALRSNLEQVLAAAAQQVKVGERNPGVRLQTTAMADEVDDAQSCCDSSWEVERRTLLGAAGSGEKNGDGSRLCRNCGEEESCVLLLPCRHLCLCTVCGSRLLICPICKSPKNAILHIKMS
ncbi:putative Ubiquitin carboxyl-terminal hydrolase family protein [Hibiscus syriacus]|uniref:Ubiquitin carboxyl-terminal hydrolase family protein n=1 Tax=Hibiscus syriacus TaxID=106335 RepID=A0A6A2ZKX7_HIBSY|nr:probable BOI-related E3 ubiquitin-protein ligase 3 [Hibiscus syriacus]KAE8692226.1 putative Ubiquitin carboxyl-terminal hydrolase family protein [Hibiscus syriacus]